MRHLVPSALVAALAVAGCSNGMAATADGGKASGRQGERSFAVSGFEAVALAGPDDVDVRVGPAFSVVARGDTGLIDALEVKTEGETLRIGRKKSGNSFSWGGQDRDASVKITVTMPRVRALALAGSGDLAVDRVDGETLAVSLAGSGDVDVGRATIARGDVSLAGSGDIRIAGTADSMKVSIVGSGDVDGTGFRAKAGDVSVAGSGNVRFDVDGDAAVAVMGSGDVDLGSRARCRTSKMGSGETRCGG